MNATPDPEAPADTLTQRRPVTLPPGAQGDLIMNCKNGHLMHSHDDVTFECKVHGCGDLKYLASNEDRIAELTRPAVEGGYGRPTCPGCGRVSVPNNGGFSCLFCSAYYELPDAERPVRLHLMSRRPEGIPAYLVTAMILLAGNLVVAGALFFGG